MENEIWKQIPDYPRYEISNYGNVRTVTLKRRKPRKTSIRRKYLSVLLSKNNKPKTFSIHRLVLTVFNGPGPKGFDACHIDGNRMNNHISNLTWASRKENISHKILHGTSQCGEKSATAKLKSNDIKDIFELRISGFSVKQIMEKYQMSQWAITSVLKGRSWKHLGLYDQYKERL